MGTPVLAWIRRGRVRVAALPGELFGLAFRVAVSICFLFATWNPPDGAFRKPRNLILGRDRQARWRKLGGRSANPRQSHTTNGHKTVDPEKNKLFLLCSSNFNK